MRNFILFTTPVLAMSLLLSCGNKDKQETTASKDIFDKTYMDSTVAAGEDFYLHSVGNWLKSNPVPASEEEWGSFQVLAKENKQLLRSILEEAAKSKAAKGSNAQKIGDFYAMGMDSVKLNQEKATPLKPYLDKIAAAKDKAELLKLAGEWQATGVGTLFGLYADQDLKNSTKVVPYLFVGGTTLPEKDYYVSQEASMKEIREKYKLYAAKLLELMGNSAENAKKSAETILRIETQLAESQMKREEQRNPYATYHPMGYVDLDKKSPNMGWKALLTTAGLAAKDSIVVTQPKYFERLSKTWQTESLEDWKTMMTWYLLADAANLLSDDFIKADFEFNSTVLSGIKENKPRWERVMKSVNRLMGEAVGQLYVEKAFKPEAKERMNKMVASLQAVFKERIQNLDWMSAETKTKAIQKLEKFLVKVGYPDKWRDYSALDIQKDSYMANIFRARGFEHKRRMDKIGKPVDRMEWGMSPQTINAYYNPSLNEIVFPAAILQPPFFDLNADDAMIYGGIGAVIGHEMTHGFDDEGRKFDAEGNLKNWWTAEDSSKFEAKANMVKTQFDNYKVLGNISVNGKLTLGENLADLGGLMIALDAFKRTEQGKKNEKIAGMTAEQRFFWAWANVWKSNVTDESMKLQIKTDPHSPNEWRVRGPLSNIAEFYSAFGIKEGDKMSRPAADRVKVW
ncbi:MAG: M13 family metallopeptidase [Bacteroidia bacterium]